MHAALAYKLEVAPKERTPERRILAIRLLHEKKTVADVATLLGVSRESVRKWKSWHEEGGKSALTNRPAGERRGPKWALDDKALARLLRAAKEQGAETLTDYVAIAAKLGIEVSRPGIRNRLIDAGIWPRRTR